VLPLCGATQELFGAAAATAKFFHLFRRFRESSTCCTKIPHTGIGPGADYEETLNNEARIAGAASIADHSVDSL
jgi:hypothetical protein